MESEKNSKEKTKGEELKEIRKEKSQIKTKDIANCDATPCNEGETPCSCMGGSN